MKQKTLGHETIKRSFPNSTSSVLSRKKALFPWPHNICIHFFLQLWNQEQTWALSASGQNEVRVDNTTSRSTTTALLLFYVDQHLHILFTVVHLSDISFSRKKKIAYVYLDDYTKSRI